MTDLNAALHQKLHEATVRPVADDDVRRDHLARIQAAADTFADR